MAVIFGQTSMGQYVKTYFRPSMMELNGMLQRIKSKNLSPDEVIPLPEGWAFQYDCQQLQVAIPAGDAHAFKLMFGAVRK